MVTGTYIVLILTTFALSVASCWLPALICGLIAFALAYRYEIRWVLDHTPLTKFAPRSVPPPRSHFRTTSRKG